MESLNPALMKLMAAKNKFGFIVVDRTCALFGSLCNNTREVLNTFQVKLPSKHGRHGVSDWVAAVQNCMQNIAEVAVQLYITNGLSNISGLILAGSADFKAELSQFDILDMRLKVSIVKVVDISCGGENGFNQAIELAADALHNIRLNQDKKLLGPFFDQLTEKSGNCCFGVEDTLKAFKMGAVQTLIVWEHLVIMRYVLKNVTTNEEKVLYLKPEETQFTDAETGVELELVDSQSLLEWFANHCEEFGAALELITDQSQEGAQFVNGFGGIGGILRYPLDMQNWDSAGDLDADFDVDCESTESADDLDDDFEQD